MRASAAGSSVGPMSLSTSLRIGFSGSDARPMPISPPIEVPNQSTAPPSELAVTRATSVTMSLTYWGI
jgi:hypothetical protein